MTSFLLSRAGIPTPATWATESYEQAHAIAERETAEGPLVLKPLFGSQGRGLKLVHRPEDLPKIEETPGRVYYLQRFIGVKRRGGYHDFRILVVQGRIVAAMRRHSNHWITNIKRGGRPLPVVINDEMKTLALQAAMAVGANFVGVDIVYEADDRPAVLEVNSMPAWSGLQKVTAVNIASVLAEALVAALADRGLRGAIA
jgi:RimK family alpha-L-glutamate ligase